MNYDNLYLLFWSRRAKRCMVCIKKKYVIALLCIPWFTSLLSISSSSIQYFVQKGPSLSISWHRCYSVDHLTNSQREAKQPTSNVVKHAKQYIKVTRRLSNLLVQGGKCITNEFPHLSPQCLISHRRECEPGRIKAMVLIASKRNLLRYHGIS